MRGYQIHLRKNDKNLELEEGSKSNSPLFVVGHLKAVVMFRVKKASATHAVLETMWN